MKSILVQLLSLLMIGCNISINKDFDRHPNLDVRRSKTVNIVDSTLLRYQGYWHCVNYLSFPNGLEKNETRVEADKNIIENYIFRIYEDTLESKNGCKTIIGYSRAKANKHTYLKKEKKDVYNSFKYKMTDSLSFLFDDTPVEMCLAQAKKDCSGFSFDDIIAISRDSLLLYLGGDFYLFEKFIPQNSNLNEHIESTIAWPTFKKNILLKNDGCFTNSTIVLPYNQRIPFNTTSEQVMVKYELLKCTVGNINRFKQGDEFLRYIPFPNKNNIRVLLVPQDKGDFRYRFCMLLITNNIVSDDLYVEGMSYDPDDFKQTQIRSYFEIDKEYNIIVTEEDHKGKKKVEKYKINDEGNFQKL